MEIGKKGRGEEKQTEREEDKLARKQDFLKETESAKFPQTKGQPLTLTSPDS